MNRGALLEREGELEVVEGAFAAASEGHGGGLIFEGSAGIGKTALLEAARERAIAGGLRVLTARGSELERDFPFGVARQLLEPPVMAASTDEREDLFRGAAAGARRVLGESGAEVVDPAAEAGFSTLNGLHWVLAGLGERQPTALLIDDLHWADPASLRFIAFLAGRVAELPCAIVAASRPGESEEAEISVAELRASPAIEFVQPSPLSEGAVATLVQDRIGRAPADAFNSACHRHTAGNPMFISELLRTIIDRGIPPDADQADLIDSLTPASVGEQVRRRLERLGEAAAKVAAAASVLGEPGSIALACDLAGVSRDEAPVARRLCEVEIFASEDPVRFMHPLIRHAIFDTLSLEERDRLNQAAMEHFRGIPWEKDRAAAHALATRPGRGEQPTVDLLRDSGADALARGAPEAAITYLRRALEEPPPPEDLAAVLRALALAQRQRGLFEAAETLRLALEAAGSRRERAGIAFDLGQAYEAFFDWPSAVAALERARAELADDDPLAVDVEAELVVTTMYDPSAVDSVPSRIEFLSRHPDSIAARQAILAAQATAALNLDGDRAGAAAAAEAALAGELLVRGSFHTSFNCLVVLIHCEEYDSVAKHLERGFEAAELTRAGRPLSGLQFMRAMHSLITGSLESAVEDLQTTQAVNAGLDWRAAADVYADAMIVEAAVELGDLDLAAVHVERLGPDSDWSGAPALFARSARARLREERGEIRAATDDLIAGRRENARWSDRGTVPPTWLWRARAALLLERLGERDEALRLARAEVKGARAFGAPRLLASSLRALGTVEGGDRGISLLEEAVAIVEGSPAVLEHARCQLALGAAMRRAGRRTDSREPLRRALDIASAAGASPLAQTAREELEASGGRPRRNRISGPDALTPSELRIAKLAADGLTNREIAQTLYLSQKTVEMHLSRAYRKLDISSRDDLDGVLPAPEGATVVAGAGH